jgi:hypothetical protein
MTYINNARTELGRGLNEGHKENTRTDIPKYYGQIIGCHKDGEGQTAYLFKVRVYDQFGLSVLTIAENVRIDDSIQSLALTNGEPENLVLQQHWCKINYMGSLSYEIVNLCEAPKGTKDLLAQTSAKANQLKIQGTAFAPPGGSFF